MKMFNFGELSKFIKQIREKKIDELSPELKARYAQKAKHRASDIKRSGLTHSGTKVAKPADLKRVKGGLARAQGKKISPKDMTPNDAARYYKDHGGKLPKGWHHKDGKFYYEKPAPVGRPQGKN